MNEIVKIPKLKYLYACIASVVYVIVLFVFAGGLDSDSMIPFILIAVFDIVNIILVKDASPRECFKLFLLSGAVVFASYKIFSAIILVNTYNADGYLVDYKSSAVFINDIMMAVNFLSTFMFTVALRFMLSKQKLKKVSRVSVKRFFICVAVIVIVGVIDIFSWKIAKPYEKEFLDYVSTFSPEKWEIYVPRRLNMYDDLMDNYDLKGMTEDEIEKLLGKPGEDGTYLLGADSQGQKNLVISYEDGKVKSVDIELNEFSAKNADKK